MFKTPPSTPGHVAILKFGEIHQGDIHWAEFSGAEFTWGDFLDLYSRPLKPAFSYEKLHFEYYQ